MKKRVVLRDVAEQAGVHITTAGRAMKNDPRVQPETLAKVQRIARELGYTPDPMLSALSIYRTVSRPSLYHGTVGWITDFPTRDGWRVETFCHYHEGAAEALARHGYRLEEFWLREPGLTARRASQILQSRGIRGLLICPLPVNCGHLSLQWNRFASVTFGYTLMRPALHLVTTSHYHHVQVCLRNLHRRGYRRVGFVTWESISGRVHQLWTAAYRTPSFGSRCEPPIPILQLKNTPELFSERNKARFLKWVEAHRVDAVLAVDRHILEWLEEGGVRIPGDVAYVSPSLQQSNAQHAGVLEPSREIGAAAGEFLAGLLHRGEYGIPRSPHRILLDGCWQEGQTIANRLPRKGGSRAF